MDTGKVDKSFDQRRAGLFCIRRLKSMFPNGFSAPASHEPKTSAAGSVWKRRNSLSSTNWNPARRIRLGSVKISRLTKEPRQRRSFSNQSYPMFEMNPCSSYRLTLVSLHKEVFSADSCRHIQFFKCTHITVMRLLFLYHNSIALWQYRSFYLIQFRGKVLHHVFPP